MASWQVSVQRLYTFDSGVKRCQGRLDSISVLESYQNISKAFPTQPGHIPWLQRSPRKYAQLCPICGHGFFMVSMTVWFQLLDFQTSTEN